MGLFDTLKKNESGGESRASMASSEREIPPGFKKVGQTDGHDMYAREDGKTYFVPNPNARAPVKEVEREPIEEPPKPVPSHVSEEKEGLRPVQEEQKGPETESEMEEPQVRIARGSKRDSCVCPACGTFIILD